MGVAASRTQPLRFIRGLLTGLIVVALAGVATLTLDATIGRTAHNCTVTDKRVEKWTSRSNSAWMVTTTCGTFDVGTETAWTAIEAGKTYSIRSTALPFEPVRKAKAVTE